MNKKYLSVLMMFGVMQICGCNNGQNNDINQAVETTREVEVKEIKPEVNVDVALAIQQALINNDYRLLHSKGRRIVVPGLESLELSLLEVQCGLKAIKNSRDVMKNAEQRQQQRTQYAFAKAFNQNMYSICLESIKK